MKYSFIIISLIFSIGLQAQSDSTDNWLRPLIDTKVIIDPPSDYLCLGFNFHSDFDFFEYDTIHQKKEFEKAMQNETSLSEKIDLLNRVGFYNCKNKYGLQAANFIDSLKNEYLKSIEHDWIWEASITNTYGIRKTSQISPYQRVLSFRNDSIIIIQNDSIILKSKLNYTELSSKGSNRIILKIQTNDILYENEKPILNCYDIIFDTELDVLFGTPKELLEKEKFCYLKLTRLMTKNPSVEIYSRKMD